MKKNQPQMMVVGAGDYTKPLSADSLPKNPTCDDTIKLVPELNNRSKERRDKIFAEVENKLKQLVLGYLRDASQDSLGKDYYYKRYDNEWEVFCTIKNKQQREVKLHPEGFKKNVEYFLELAKANTAETLKTDEAPVTEHRGETN